MAELKFLDLQGLTTYDGKIKGKIAADDAITLQSAKSYTDELANDAVANNTSAITKLNGADTVEGSVAKQVKNAKDGLQTQIGTLTELTTDAKTNLVGAINEVKEDVDATTTASKITIETQTTTEGMAKSYTLKQGSATIGVIDIPKDMVVSSGTVETDPEEHDPGTYLVLTLANATSDKIYINVGTLVDIYTAKANATQVQLSISGREISASIVAGSISSAELANSSVVTAKIADGNVTKAKLETTVQSSLDKADSALQKADITSGTTNGTISVDGSDVSVKGLASAAYATAGSAVNNVPVVGTALGTTANVPVVITAEGKIAPHASGALKSAAFAETTAFDAAGTAQGLVTALEEGQVATNTSDITDIKERLDEIEGTTVSSITEEEILGLFA